MKNEKINLNNVKVAIFDFDDTLAIHKDKDYIRKRNESEEYLLNYFYKAYLNPTEFYETIEPCDVCANIVKLINRLRKHNVKIYCVSGMRFSFHLKAKKYFVHKHYGEDIKFFSSRSQETKLEAAKIIALINKCKLNEMIFVDDRIEVLKKAQEIGIKSYHPSSIIE